MALRDLEVGEEEIEVARWLEESGRRRVNKEWLQRLTAPDSVLEISPSTGLQGPGSREYVTRPSTLCLLALTALSYLLYFFADVELQISSMRRMVVFVFS